MCPLSAGAGDQWGRGSELFLAADLLRRADVFCQGRGLSCPIRCSCPGGCGCLLGTDLHDAGGHCGGAEYDPLAGIGAAAGSKALAGALLRL